MANAQRFTKKPTAAEKGAAAAEKAEKEAQLAADALAAKQTAEQQDIAEKDELYAKALNERADLTLVPVGKIKKNHTVKQVSDKVYPGDMVIAERL
ncbi:hypothetical protein [Mesorhizobium sp.]|uniref:hypothetical protein n=1 Tax=Mesorhizobium sp. TaxID=1871066 RepID=UPI000FE7F6B9|nr:hypothetical protein [Mesorhizobium sp.]RWE44225.1 MAG: hypothetical protein EOS80_20000 [Mesorhizobium sp.]